MNTLSIEQTSKEVKKNPHLQCKFCLSRFAFNDFELDANGKITETFLALAWDTKWFNMGAIREFVLVCSPGPAQLRNKPIDGDRCLTWVDVDWIGLENFLNDPIQFVHDFHAAGVRITEPALKQLARFIDQDQEDFLNRSFCSEERHGFSGWQQWWKQ